MAVKTLRKTPAPKVGKNLSGRGEQKRKKGKGCAFGLKPRLTRLFSSAAHPPRAGENNKKTAAWVAAPPRKSPSKSRHKGKTVKH